MYISVDCRKPRRASPSAFTFAALCSDCICFYTISNWKCYEFSICCLLSMSMSAMAMAMATAAAACIRASALFCYFFLYIYSVVHLFARTYFFCLFFSFVFLKRATLTRQTVYLMDLIAYDVYKIRYKFYKYNNKIWLCVL